MHLCHILDSTYVRELLSCVQLFVTPWTVDCQATLYMEVYRQEYWSELPFPPPGRLPDPGIEPLSPTLVGGFFFFFLILIFFSFIFIRILYY